MHFLPITYILYLTACFYGVLAAVTFTRKRTPITMFFGTMLVLCGIWAAAYSAELGSEQLPEKIFWMKFQLAFTPYLGAAALALALAVTGMSKSFSRWFWLVVLIYPYITTTLALTDWFPEFFRYDFAIETYRGVSILTYSCGLWHTIHDLTFYGTCLLALLVLLSAWHSSSPLLRRQIVLLTAAYIFPIAGNLVYSYHLLPELGIDPGPFLLLPSMAMLTYIIYRYRILDLIPIARSIILDHMNDGLIVLDSYGQTVDVNTVAESWMKIRSLDVLGFHPENFPEPWSSFLAQTGSEKHTFQMKTGKETRWYTCRSIEIAGHKNEVKGTLLLIRDTTVENLHRIVRIQNRKRKAELQQLKVQKLLTRDIHDGLGGLAANMALITALARKEPDTAKKDQWLDKLQLLTGETNVEIRELMNTLECSTMGWPDVIDAVRRISTVMFDDRVTDARTQVDGTPPAEAPGMTAGMSIVRMAKECMNNIIKHAEADQVRISLAFTPDTFALMVNDNGKGFDPETVRRGRGLGNLHKRTAELCGTLTFENAGGSRLTFTFPLPIQTAETSTTEADSDETPDC